MGERSNKERCECGWVLRRPDLPLHRRSVYHRQHQRIKSLLGNDSITQSEIARRLGVSRERVRQIADRISPGRVERIRAYAALRRESARVDHPELRERQRRCADNGLGYGLVREGGEWRRVIINGHSCLIRPMNLGGNVHWRISPSILPADFYLYKGTGRWLILPADKMPAKATSFSEAPDLGRPQRGQRRGCRHDWSSYFEAWHLLKT